MKIAVITPIKHLDVYNLLCTKGTVFLLENGTKHEVRELILKNDVDAILCNPNKQGYIIDEELLAGSKVSLINTCSTGTNHIDIQYCKDNKIAVYSLTTDYDLIHQLTSTSELAFGLMLSLLRNIPKCTLHTSQYNWDYTQFVGRQVKDLNVGIIGYGRLGKMMAAYCTAFGANVFINDPYVDVIQTELDVMFKTCDVVSIHVHLTPKTTNLINKELLDLIQKKLYIINTSRGSIVNELDIVDALKKSKLAGYATDVLADELDTITNSPIIDAMNSGYNIIVTPHIGGMTIEGQNLAYAWAINKF